MGNALNTNPTATPSTIPYTFDNTSDIAFDITAGHH
jgi:hypothetical protein